MSSWSCLDAQWTICASHLINEKQTFVRWLLRGWYFLVESVFSLPIRLQRAGAQFLPLPTFHCADWEPLTRCRHLLLDFRHGGRSVKKKCTRHYVPGTVLRVYIQDLIHNYPLKWSLSYLQFAYGKKWGTESLCNRGSERPRTFSWYGADLKF